MDVSLFDKKGGVLRVSILRDGEQAGLALLQLCEEFVLWRND
jgi:hypothetical protein